MAEHNVKNKENYSFISGAKIWISKLTSGSYGTWKSLGNIIDHTLTPALERLAHNTNYRGKDKQDHSIVKSTTFAGKITVDELVKHVMQYLIMSSVRTESTSYEVPDAENKTWTGATVEINSGAEIASVIEVLHLSNADAYEEGATGDYTVDLATGTLTKTVGTTIGEGEEVIISYTTTETTTKYNVMDATDAEVRMQIVHKNDAGPKHCIFLPSVKISLDGDIAFPKDAWMQAVFNLEILEDDTYGYGQWYQW